MSGLLLALGLAASAPKILYKPNPAASSDIGTVELIMPRHACFGVTRVSVLLSSRKSDRSRVWALSAAIADNPSVPLPHISAAAAGSSPLPLVNVRDGDVACTDYQCQTGSAAVFGLDEAHRAAGDGPLAVQIANNGGSQCGVPAVIEPTVFKALEIWAERLPAPKGD